MGTYVHKTGRRIGQPARLIVADLPRLPRCRPALVKPARTILATKPGGLVFDMAAHEQQRFLRLAHALRLAVLVHGRAYGWQVEVVDNDVTARREAPKACGR